MYRPPGLGWSASMVAVRRTGLWVKLGCNGLDGQGFEELCVLCHELLLLDPGVLVPDLDPAVDADDNYSTLQIRVLAQVRRHDKSSLAVELAGRGAAEQRPGEITNLGANLWKIVDGAGKRLPLGCRVDAQAGVEAACEHRPVTESDPQL